jgi:hypothetical protein
MKYERPSTAIFRMVKNKEERTYHTVYNLVRELNLQELFYIFCIFWLTAFVYAIMLSIARILQRRMEGWW